MGELADRTFHREDRDNDQCDDNNTIYHDGSRLPLNFQKPTVFIPPWGIFFHLLVFYPKD